MDDNISTLAAIFRQFHVETISGNDVNYTVVFQLSAKLNLYLFIINRTKLHTTYKEKGCKELINSHRFRIISKANCKIGIGQI